MRYEKITFTRQGNEVTIPIPMSYRDVFLLIKSDYYRLSGTCVSIAGIFLRSFWDSGIKFLFWMRMSAYRGWAYMFCRACYQHCRNKYGIDIHPATKIGYGLYLGHAISMVVSKTAVIGNNVNLSQMINIGSNHGKAAVIGDNVYIGPSTCLVEDVEIGNDVIIGAGSVVVKDVPSGKTVVGNPGRVIGENRHTEYIGNRWPVRE